MNGTVWQLNHISDILAMPIFYCACKKRPQF